MNRVSSRYALVGVLLASLSTTPLRAQGECGTCRDSFAGGFSHEFAESGAFFRCAPYSCHYFVSIGGICSEMHYNCIISEAGTRISPSQKADLLRKVETAAAKADIHLLRVLVESNPGLLRIGTSGRTVEHVDCSGALLGYVTVASPLVVSVRPRGARWRPLASFSHPEVAFLR